MRSPDAYARLMTALAERATAVRQVMVEWSVAGELDSPIPPERLAQARARPPCSLDALLDRAEPGQIVLLGHESPPRWIEEIVAGRALRHRKGEGRAPVWARGWALDLLGEPRIAIEQHLARFGGVLPPESRLIVIERPDLAVDGNTTIDGMALRSALRRWSAALPTDILFAVIGPDCFAFHDPYPGWIKARPLGEAPAAHAKASPALASESAGYYPRAHLPADLLAAVGARAAGATEQDFAPIYQLLGTETVGHALGDIPPEAGLGALDTETLRQWLRALIVNDDRPAGLAREIRTPRKDALAAVRLYRLLHAHQRDGARRNLTGCDVGRWFCYLRAFGYEMLSAVASKLDREHLRKMNLMHAPPMAFSSLRGVDLSAGDLYRVDLSFADVRDVNFAGADLSRSHLKGADLRGADLRGADLSYASLELADLRGAKTEGANLFRCHTDDCRWD